MSNISRRAYADMFGPTVGDKVRPADTELWIEVEDDLTTYGEEVKFGGGKVIRDGMGRGADAGRRLCRPRVLTNALIVDHWGIVKADIGVKDGRIFAIGKAGNPDIQPNVTIPIGASTEVIAAEGKLSPPAGSIPYSLDLSAAGGRGAGLRRDHHGRRRHRPGRGHPCHHLHPRARGISHACCRRPTACRSISACWARATFLSRMPCASRWRRALLA